MAKSVGSSYPGSRPPGWMATELGARVVSALVLAVVALAATYQGGWPFVLLWLLAGIVVLAEWIGMTQVEPRLPIKLILAAGLVVLAVLDLADTSGTGALLAVALAAAAAAAVARRSRDRLWAVAGLAYAAIISVVPPVVRETPELGVVGILWMFAVVWLTDVVAYFTGRRFGGPKLWPQVSPKKTWSGFGGGLVAGTVGGMLVAWIAARFGWTPPLGFTALLIVSAIASVASQMGDLAESALKRRFDAKDSGHLIPGHGGVMDRLDGFWAVALLLGIALLLTSLLRS